MFRLILNSSKHPVIDLTLACVYSFVCMQLLQKHFLQKEMQLLTLNEELSDMKSRVMTKTLQYQQVVEEKRQLIKRIRHLESAVSIFVVTCY